MNIFFLSDTHFGHANILNFKNKDGSPLRMFPSVEAMDEHMVERWNAVVRPSDHVYHLGDVAMRREYLKTVARCNGHKRLVRGNHDIYRTKEYLLYFEEIYGVRMLDNILFSHIPLHPDSLYPFKSNVHGHVHALPQGSLGPCYYNVSVEVIDYTPVSLEELKLRLKKVA
jgi:calcineurin-like phosphoesterase family protein